MVAKILLFIALVMALSTVNCAQKLIDLGDSKDISIDIERIGKPGISKKYLIPTGDKPINPQIPNNYRVFEKKYYKIQTDIIAYGQTIFTFKAVANQEDFSKVRILHLISNELNTHGFEWEDCTVTPDKLGDPAAENYSAKAAGRLKKFLPNFPQKTVSCELGNAMKSEEFFVVGTLTKMPPAEPFTKITWNLETQELSSQNGAINYKVTFTNAGTNDIAEFNFRSIFADDTRLNSFEPSQGNCRTSTYGSSYGSVVCYMGKIPAGKSVTLKLEGENSGLGGMPSLPDKKNENWEIFGYFKESPNDPNWNMNSVWFNPIPNRDLSRKDAL